MSFRSEHVRVGMVPQIPEHASFLALRRGGTGEGSRVWTCSSRVINFCFRCYFVFITLCQPVCLAPVWGPNRPLMCPCQQPLPGVPGSWHTHSAQTQSTTSHCCLIGSSSCGNQFHWNFLRFFLEIYVQKINKTATFNTERSF